jgi:hypothetical protein
MTTIDLNSISWSVNEVRVLRRLFKEDLTLRQSRPEIVYEKVHVDGQVYEVPERWSGIAAYVWRMIVFTISTRAKHQCLPIMADSYLPVYPGMTPTLRDAYKQFAEALADKICSLIPPTEWHGIARWNNLI